MCCISATLNNLSIYVSRTATGHSRINEKVKTKADRILYALVIKPYDANDMYYRQIIFCSGIPFSIVIPNKKTHRAIEELENGKDLKSFKDEDELFTDLDG